MMIDWKKRAQRAEELLEKVMSTRGRAFPMPAELAGALEAPMGTAVCTLDLEVVHEVKQALLDAGREDASAST